ncbi:hypothetical protein V5799_024182 [Amblyomma americanum]|uniref:Uncharacterized protein n=1 Tax=Amblyomma americanum TaxID=6943 RepID=A0AAQ4ED66_AMBAM
MLTYFNNASDDLAQTLTNLEQGRYSHLRGTTMKTSSSLNYVQLVLLPVLTALFDHLAANEFGSDLLLSDIQVACYKILNSLYTLGTNLELHGAVMATLESSMPTLDDLMGQVEKFVTGSGKYTEQPFIIDVMVPMLCRNHVTMVTSDHLTSLLKNILNLLRKTVNTEGSPWMITIAGHAGQIVINSSEELLRDPVLPLMEKVRQCADAVFHKEECMRSYLKSSTDDTSQAESQLQEIDPSDAMSWQHYLYSKLGSQRSTPVGHNAVVPIVSQDQLVERIMDMAKVLYGLHVIDHAQGSQKGAYRSVVSTQRKRAVIACFRMTSLHSLPR